MFWNTKRLRRRLLLVLAAVGVGLGASAIALATIPDSNGVIHGCYLNKDGALRVIDDSASSCRPGETPLDWSQSGPPGPQGEQGPPGAPATALWALVDSDGTLLAGSGVPSVSHIGQGEYLVEFDETVQLCAGVATPWYPALAAAVADVAVQPQTKSVAIGGSDGLHDSRFQIAVFC
jgi:hypothetical protein